MNLKKWLVLNVIMSLAAFAFVFYKCAGVSGGDVAIGVYTVFFGVLQSIGILVLTVKAKHLRCPLLLSLLIAVCIELFVMVQWGYVINEWIKHTFLRF